MTIQEREDSIGDTQYDALRDDEDLAIYERELVTGHEMTAAEAEDFMLEEAMDRYYDEKYGADGVNPTFDKD